MDKIYTVNPEEVFVQDDRHRKHFDKKADQALFESIQVYGQFTPGICSYHWTPANEEVLNLVAGERRLRTCKALGISFKYLLLDEIDDPDLLEEIEIEENIRREGFTWLEEVNAKARLHELQQKRYGKTEAGRRGGHRVEDTAVALGESKGLVSQDLELSMWAAEVPEVAEAKNKTEAKRIVKRLKGVVERRDKLEEASQTVETAESVVAGGTDQDSVMKKFEYFMSRSIHGTFEEEMRKVEDGSIDVVCFDPPWGINLANKKKGKEYKEASKYYDDSPEQYVNSLKRWLEVIYEKMSEHSHLYMFFGIVHHEFAYNTLESVGFAIDRIPIIWFKQGAHSTRNPETLPGRSYEPIAYARKGRKLLASRGRQDVVITPPMFRRNQDHPDPKHPNVYIDLLERSCAPGDKVLDPMSGSGMFGVACERMVSSLRLDWRMIEKVREYHELGIFNLLQGYEAIVKTPSPFLSQRKAEPSDKYDRWADSLAEQREAQAPNTFEGLEPGTPEWKEYWKAHPEEQDAMLAYAAERRMKNDTD